MVIASLWIPVDVTLSPTLSLTKTIDGFVHATSFVEKGEPRPDNVRINQLIKVEWTQTRPSVNLPFVFEPSGRESVTQLNRIFTCSKISKSNSTSILSKVSFQPIQCHNWNSVKSWNENLFMFDQTSFPRVRSISLNPSYSFPGLSHSGLPKSESSKRKGP